MHRNTAKAVTVGAILLVTLSLHYNVLPLPEGIHHLLHQTDLHRRFCYLPIILGALWFGLKGGLLTSAVISAAVAPLAARHPGSLATSADFLEILFYLALGSLAGTLVDLRERERVRKERLERDLAAAERQAALGRAAAGIAHEVRTPLGSILGAAEILGEDYPEGHPRRSFYSILVEEGRRLGRVVEDFLDLGRTPALRLAPVSLEVVLAEALESVRAYALSREVQLRVLGSTEEVRLEGDADRLRQALANLLRNAVEASNPGASVHTEVGQDRSSVWARISDEGPGISEGDEVRIFEPFYTGRREGTGLGLALARQIAVAHGGSLVLAPSPGVGACFELRLPTTSRGPR